MPHTAPNPYREKKPWGSYEKFTENEISTVKILTVNPAEAFSLQQHKNRSEFWRIISGEGKVTIGDKTLFTKAGDEHFVPEGINHRLEAGDQALIVLEISFGDFDEADITRIEDKYGRI